MTDRESLDFIVDIVNEGLGTSKPLRISNREKQEKLSEAFKNIDKLIKKATPMKILGKDIEGFDTIFGCPHCGITSLAWDMGIKDPCCTKCGQAIDWSEGDE